MQSKKLDFSPPADYANFIFLEPQSARSEIFEFRKTGFSKKVYLYIVFCIEFVRKNVKISLKTRKTPILFENFSTDRIKK